MLFFDFLLLGQHSLEGFEHETTGGVHVQRVEEAGLWRGLPLALPVHRLKQLTPTPNHKASSPPSTGRRIQPPLPSEPSYSTPPSVNQVCLHFQNNQYSSIPIDFYWSKIWFCTYSIPICSFVIFFFFF